MTASNLLFLVLILACPLMMMFMMRGGHGHHGGEGGGSHGDKAEAQESSTDDLRRQRAELDRLIEKREQFELRQAEREPMPTGRFR